MSYQNAVRVALDADCLRKKLKRYITWDYAKFPHMLLFGSTGSGKTYLLKVMLARIRRYVSGAKIILCDFKADTDFAMFRSAYRFLDCTDGLAWAVRILQDRQADLHADRYPLFLVFDEWAAYLTMLDKKAADTARQQLAVLLMLGRSFNIHVIVSQQRVDSTFFNAGARDNFSVIIGMGKLSKESVQMMFSDCKDSMNPCMQRGCGNLLIGGDHYTILVPQVRKPARVDHFIGKALIHCPSCAADGAARGAQRQR